MGFSILKKSEDVILLEILGFEGDLESMSHPYLDGGEKYIKVTRNGAGFLLTFYNRSFEAMYTFDNLSHKVRVGFDNRPPHLGIEEMFLEVMRFLGER